MPNIPITNLPTVSNASLSDIIYAVQGYVSPSVPGTSSQETLQQVFNLMLANTVLHNAGNPNGTVAGILYQLCWDTAHNVFYICTTSGPAASVVWTAIAPASGVINPLDGGTGVANPTAHTFAIGEGSLPFNFVGPLGNGQILIGSAGLDPQVATVTAGSGISIVNGPGSITVNATGALLGWTDVTGITQTMIANGGYTANNGSQVVFTLPSSAAYGTALSVIGKGAGGWKINVGAGQNMQVGSVSTTVSTGSVASTNQFDSIDMICTTANLTWTVIGAPQGNLTIV
jgi:hypothetical protein